MEDFIGLAKSLSFLCEVLFVIDVAAKRRFLLQELAVQFVTIWP